MNQTVAGAVYVSTLGSIPGMGPKRVLRIVEAFPHQDVLLNASADRISQRLGASIADALSGFTHDEWPTLWKAAEERILRHLDRQIAPIPIVSPKYPKLLRLIDDPPVILYVRGNDLALDHADAVAVVGTREPTDMGLRVARRLAKFFAERGFLIVSGLAKGIDTAAHEGALDGAGQTVAVMATPLD